MMIKRFPLYFLVILLGCACNATRVITPLEKNEIRLGASIGGPQVNSQTLPLISIYGAKGVSQEKTLYAGLQILNLGFQSLQMDAGMLTQMKKSSGLLPELNLKTGLNGMMSFRDAATRIYPEIGIMTVWGEKKIRPYLGSDVWIDPFYGLTELGKGALIHPSLQAGLRYIGRYIELGVEAKWLNPTRNFIIPQQTVPSFFGIGARGIYFTLAYRIR